MSQLMLLISLSNLPPAVPTSFVTDNGTVIPVGGVVNVNGGLTDSYNENGIQVIANPDGSDNLEVQITNTITGSLTTTDGSSQQIAIRNLGAVAGTYVVEGNLVAHNVT